MALTASVVTPVCCECKIMLFKSLSCRLPRPLLGDVCVRRMSAAPMKTTRMELLGHPPNGPPKFKMHVDSATKKLREAIPDSLQNFPWLEAENSAMKQLLTLSQEALKWSLVALFVLGSLSDIIYAISRNKELLIPLGLSSGCLVAEFLKETYREYLHCFQERGNTWHPLGMGFLFVLVRIGVIYFSAVPSVFLLHVANGGLMHVLWQWKIASHHPEADNRTNVTLEDSKRFKNENRV